ncbi:protein [Escherichia coli]|uniref:Protein n=1 Tax=Escherichia coli TaxID=562 RepID=A0A2X3K821_ECOLX|nr:protein [Escherichia coli]
MKKIICLVITLLMTLPAYAKLTAHEEARINAMLGGISTEKGFDILCATVMNIPAMKRFLICV